MRGAAKPSWHHLTLLFLALGSAACALTAEEPPKPSRTVFNLTGGLAMDGRSNEAWILQIKSFTYIGESPWYWGMGSTMGEFVSTHSSIAETLMIAGYCAPINGSELGLDLSLILIPYGNRVDMATKKYLSESPAVEPHASLTFPAANDFDVTLGAWATLRPYDVVDGKWDFGRSYWGASIALDMKTYALIQRKPWAESMR
jgi:hypothetical protein